MEFSSEVCAELDSFLLRVSSVLDEDLRSSIVAEFFLELNKVSRPIELPELFFKRIITDLVRSARRNLYVKQTKKPQDTLPEVSLFKEDVILPVRESVLSSGFKDCYETIVVSLSGEALLDIAGSGSFFGHVLLSSIFAEKGQKRENFFISEKGHISQLSYCLFKSGLQASVFIRIVFGKICEFWVVPFYLIYRGYFLVSLFTFLSEVLGVSQQNLKKLFFYSEVYSFIEPQLASKELSCLFKEASKKYHIRVRDVKCRYFYVKRLLCRYDSFMDSCVERMRADVREFGF